MHKHAQLGQITAGRGYLPFNSNVRSNKMKNTILLILMLVSINVYSANCSKIVKFNQETSIIYSVCPNLEKLSSKEAERTIENIFASREFVPDEYLIYFVVAEKNIKNKIEANALIGSYYTHSHNLTLWPEMPTKMKVIEFSK